MTIRGICELTLETPAPRELAGFYTSLLGFRVLSEEEERIWLAVAPDARLGLWSPGRKEFGDRGGRHVHFAFSIDRGGLHALIERLRERGVEHCGPVEHEGGDRSVYFEDPEGNVVEVWDYFQSGNGARHGVMSLREKA